MSDHWANNPLKKNIPTTKGEAIAHGLVSSVLGNMLFKHQFKQFFFIATIHLVCMATRA